MYKLPDVSTDNPAILSSWALVAAPLSPAGPAEPPVPAKVVMIFVLAEIIRTQLFPQSEMYTLPKVSIAMALGLLS